MGAESVSHVLLVCGASGGLGRRMLHEAATRGWTAVAASRDGDALTQIADQFGVHTVCADVSGEAGADLALAACKEAVGAPDLMVNCAGEVFIAPLHRTSAEQYRQCMQANADTAFFSLKAFVSALRDAKKPGAAVLISTVAAQIGVQNHEAVAASKGAVEALVRSAAATYAEQKIRVNGVAPGLTETPAVAKLMASDRVREGLARQYPLGRYGHVDDLAAAAGYLLSDDAAWVTGQVLSVDGGFTAVRPMVR